MGTITVAGQATSRVAANEVGDQEREEGRSEAPSPNGAVAPETGPPVMRACSCRW